LRYVPLAGFNQRAASQLRRATESIIGDVHVKLEAWERLPRGPNGKLRAVLCELTPEQRQAALGPAESGMAIRRGVRPDIDSMAL
jgi:hypothetical protein